MAGENDRRRKLTEFAELAVGNQKSAQGTQTVKGLVAVLLSSGLVDGRTGNLSTSTGDESRLP